MKEFWGKDCKTAISVAACVVGALAIAAIALLLFLVSSWWWGAMITDLLRRTLPGLVVLVLALCVQRQGGHILWLLGAYAVAAFAVYWLLLWGGELVAGRQIAENINDMARAGDLAGKWKMALFEYNTGAVLAAIGTLALLRGRPISAAWSGVLIIVASFTMQVAMLIAGGKAPVWLFTFLQLRQYAFPLIAALPQCIPKSVFTRLKRPRL